MQTEPDRINDTYNKYLKNNTIREKWSKNNIGNILMQKELYDTINNYIIQKDLNFKKSKMLEVGCAGGSVISNFKNFGVNENNITGIDIRKNRLEDAKTLYPNVEFCYMDAQNLTFKDNFFDIITVFTLFSSVIDISIKQNIANQIKRVLNETGIIFYYDLKIPSSNKNVLSLRKREIRSLFPDMKLEFKSITLIPPISRLIGDYSKLLYPLLSSVFFLRSHYLVLISHRKA